MKKYLICALLFFALVPPCKAAYLGPLMGGVIVGPGFNYCTCANLQLDTTDPYLPLSGLVPVPGTNNARWQVGLYDNWADSQKAAKIWIELNSSSPLFAGISGPASGNWGQFACDYYEIYFHPSTTDLNPSDEITQVVLFGFWTNETLSCFSGIAQPSSFEFPCWGF